MDTPLRLTRHPAALLVAAWLVSLAPCWGADRPDIRFLSLEQGRLTIVDDSDDPYFARLQPQEMGAKTAAAMPTSDLAWQRNACRERYQGAVRTFTPAEQSTLTAHITALYPLLHQHYPLFAAEPWRFIKLDRRFEGGAVTTRGHCIVLPEDLLHDSSAASAQTTDEHVLQLLVSAQSHVVQRYHRELFATLYGQRWGFVHLAKPPLLPFEFLDHQYLSPDGIDRDWAFPVTVGSTTMLLQMHLFLRSTSALPKLPQELDQVAMPLEANDDSYRYIVTPAGHAQLYELSTVRPYLAAFAPAQHLIHPNDIEAELFSVLITAELSGHPLDPMPACVSSLASWAASSAGFAPAAAAAK